MRGEYYLISISRSSLMIFPCSSCLLMVSVLAMIGMMLTFWSSFFMHTKSML